MGRGTIAALVIDRSMNGTGFTRGFVASVCHPSTSRCSIAATMAPEKVRGGLQAVRLDHMPL